MLFPTKVSHVKPENQFERNPDPLLLKVVVRGVANEGPQDPLAIMKNIIGRES